MSRIRSFFFISVSLLAINYASAVQKAPGAKQSIHDEDIQYPTSMTANIDSLLSDWVATNHLSIDNNCIHSSENPAIPDSVYIDRLAKLPSMIEMPYNQIVRSYINLYAGRLRERVSYMLGLTHFYFPLFEQALDAEGLPLELKYLPVIESALNPAATSRVGAAGLWQFMIYTGHDYGLEINNMVDERRDPIKSTYVAVRYLKALHRIYGDWNLAIAAYNCGPGNVNKAIRRSGGKKDYWEIYFYLPKETRGYVPAFIAVNYLMNYATEHNICSAKCNLPLNSDTIQVSKMMHFQQIADVLNVPVQEIRIMNPQYRKDLIPGNIKPHTLRLPMNSAYAFVDLQDSIANYKADQYLLNFRKTVDPTAIDENSLAQIKIRHRLGKKESLESVAQRYGVALADLKSWNNLHSSSARRGTMLVIYKEKTSSASDKAVLAQSTTHNVDSVKVSVKVAERSAPVKKVPVTATAYHKVKKGETLSEIADKYNVSVGDLKSWNKIKRVKLKPGVLLAYKYQTVKSVKETKPQDERLAKTQTTVAKKYKTETIAVVEHHAVKKGETLLAIAKKYKVSTADLKKWNHLHSNKLGKGDEIAVHIQKTKTVLVQDADDHLTAQTKSKDVSRASVDSVNNVVARVERKQIVKSNIPAIGFEYYLVRKGDTLWAIASRYPGLSVEQILQANQMNIKDAIQVGMRIKIPKS